MHCDQINLNGMAMIICRSGSRPKCKFCRTRPATKLCDAPVGRGRTCDAQMCEQCALTLNGDKDLCPDHRCIPIQLPLIGDAA
ncbi:MAG TPA: hypothetical protein VFB79_18695 [Candidatus Angelobacter sp.]|nr:hypothetical protein [Candidatus Angelobacter sp.]